MPRTPSPNKIHLQKTEASDNHNNGSILNTSNTSSRSRGIGLNLAISPMSIETGRSRKNSTLSQVDSIPESLSPSSNKTSDIQLPPMEEVIKLGVEEQLRLLAMKEMAMVELKDTIATLSNKLKHQERQTQKLRTIIQKSLYTEINLTQAGNSNIDIKRDKSLWSNLSKPLHLIQQFDTMLQNEFERSLMPEVEANQDSASSSSSPLKGKSQDINFNGLDDNIYKDTYDKETDVKVTDDKEIYSKETYAQEYQKYKNSHNKEQDDVLQSVGSSIWSFVNDVKSNVLNSINEDEYNEDGKAKHD